MSQNSKIYSKLIILRLLLGAPLYDTRKKNLDFMLEPKNSRESYRPVYDPTASLSPAQTLGEFKHR